MTIPASALYKIEIVAPGKRLLGHLGHPGVRIIGSFKLKRFQKITVALGQRGKKGWRCGCGSSFLVLESDEGQKPLLIADGYGSVNSVEELALRKLEQGSVESRTWKQNFFPTDRDDSLCAGAGRFWEPQLPPNLPSGGSFSAVRNATLTRHLVDYGYCKIKKIE